MNCQSQFNLSCLTQEILVILSLIEQNYTTLKIRIFVIFFKERFVFDGRQIYLNLDPSRSFSATYEMGKQEGGSDFFKDRYSVQVYVYM